MRTKLVLVLLFVAENACADIYKCVDPESGRTTFSNYPEPGCQLLSSDRTAEPLLSLSPRCEGPALYGREPLYALAHSAAGKVTFGLRPKSLGNGRRSVWIVTGAPSGKGCVQQGQPEKVWIDCHSSEMSWDGKKFEEPTPQSVGELLVQAVCSGTSPKR